MDAYRLTLCGSYPGAIAWDEWVRAECIEAAGLAASRRAAELDAANPDYAPHSVCVATGQ